MGRGFSEAERGRIDTQLRARGRELFARHGVKGSSVDDLVAGAGISKGSFYAFYESKEELFLQLLEEIEVESRAKLLRQLQERTFVDPAEEIYFFLREQYRLATEIPFLRRNLRPEVLAHLSGRIGEERFRAHRAQDDDFLRGVAAEWLERGVIEAEDLDRVIELWKAPYWVYLHADEAEEGEAAPGTGILDDLLRAIAVYHGRREE